VPPRGELSQLLPFARFDVANRGAELIHRRLARAQVGGVYRCVQAIPIEHVLRELDALLRIRFGSIDARELLRIIRQQFAQRRHARRHGLRSGVKRNQERFVAAEQEAALTRLGVLDRRERLGGCFQRALRALQSIGCVEIARRRNVK
jgi:hypothetical protein